MRLRVLVSGGMGGVPGAEERGRVVGGVGRAGPGHVILSLGPLPGMASPLALRHDTPESSEDLWARLRAAASANQFSGARHGLLTPV